ncbi:MAG: MFS transporter [Phycisphaerales bacterium]|nr:MFS transporter [Phycisphaerales bacterium]
MAAIAATSGRLPRQVIVLGWVSFFADVSSEMAYPLIPLFVTVVLGASGGELGAIEGLGAVLVAMLTGWAGWRSDRSGKGGPRRVPFVRWGYGLPVLGKAIIASATAWPMVLVGRAIDRVGKGLRGSPRDALIADATRPEVRGRAFGFHRAMDTGGAFVGVLLSAGILWWLGASEGEVSGFAVRAILFVAAGVGVASAVCTFWVKEAPAQDPEVESAPERKGKQAGDGESGASTERMRAVGALGREYWWTVAPLLLFAVANSSDAFILLRASDVGFSPLSVVLAYALFNLAYTVASYPVGVMADRIGKWRTIAGGWLIYAGAYAGFALVEGAGMWGLLALYGLYAAMTEGVGKALVSNVAPAGMRGTAIGVLSMSLGLAMLVASVVAGVLWDHVSHAAPFWFGAAMALLAVATIPIACRAGRWARGRSTPE